MKPAEPAARPAKPARQPRKEIKSPYVFDSEAITLNTEIALLPKKNEIIPKPEHEDYVRKDNEYRREVDKLIDQKKQIWEENFKAAQIKGQEGDSKQENFMKEIEVIKQLREDFAEARAGRDALRKRLTDLIEDAKKNNALLITLRKQLTNSRSTYQEELEESYRTLTTADLSKDQEKRLNERMSELKMKLADAVDEKDVQRKLERAEDEKDRLDDEIQEAKDLKEPLEKKCKAVAAELDEKNAELDEIRSKINKDNKERTDIKTKNNQEWEKWKQSKKDRIAAINKKIDDLKVLSNKVWDDFNVAREKYWHQKHLIDYIEWQTREKNRKIRDKDREQQAAMFEEKEKEWKKKEQLAKYATELEVCGLLVNHLRAMKTKQDSDEKLTTDSEANKVDHSKVLAKLASDPTAKGFQLIIPKKVRDEDEPKKSKKNQKKREVKQEKEEPGFNIPYDVQAQYDILKIIPPRSFEEVDAKIVELQEREQLFIRFSKEQVSETDAALLDKLRTNQPPPAESKPKPAEKATGGSEFPDL